MSVLEKRGIKICPAKWWQFQNFYMRLFMGSNLVERNNWKFHLHSTLHMFEKALVACFKDLAMGAVLVLDLTRSRP